MRKTNVFEAKLKGEGLAPLDGDDSERPVRAPYGAQAQDAAPENIALSAEMSAAIHDIIDHPALDPRHREILAAYLENDCNWNDVAKKARCSKAKIAEVIARVKELMLHPGEAPTAVDVSDEDDTVELSTPPESALSFADIESSLEISARTAHRIIKAVSQVPIIGNGELKANESATRTLVLLRRSELEYLGKAGKRPKADPEELHEIASKNKVSG